MSATLTSYEAIDLILSLSGQIDTLFNFWLSASFAVILSAFIGRAHFALLVTAAISALYAMGCILFAARFLVTIDIFVQIGGIATIETGSNLILYARVSRFLLGCLMTQVYLWMCHFGGDGTPLSAKT